MSNALDQQGNILAEQTKIMDEQFKFQRAATAQADRQVALDSLVDLRTPALMLISRVQEPGERYPPRVAEEQRLQAATAASILPAKRAVMSSNHLTPEEKKYFGCYIDDVSEAVASNTNLPAALPKLRHLDVKYADFLAMVAKGR